MNLKKRSIFLIVAVFLSGSAFAGTYSGGKGEPNDPYLIATAEDLNDINNHPEDFNKCFLMVNDINLADYTGTQFNIIGYYEDYESPNNAPFTGVFDGNGHTISNFTYETTDTDNIGLFSYVDGPNAVIKDLTLINPKVLAEGYSAHIGCLVGSLADGTISSCIIEDGSVLGDGFTGGLAGDNGYGNISNCCAKVIVSGKSAIGGLVGVNSGII